MKLHLARVTLEAKSPLSVGSGEPGLSDVLLVRDAAGLPMIPGASVQGLLRALAEREQWSDVVALFGNPENKPEKRDAKAGQIRFSDARIHLSNDKSVSGREAGQNDAFLALLCTESPLLRDHVRIDHLGAGDDGGKFDRSAVPRGARFSLELSFWDQVADDDAFIRLLQLFHHPLFRPGGGRSKGYGKVAARVSLRSWDDPETNVDVIGEIREAPFSEHPDFVEIPAGQSFSAITSIELALKSAGYWRLGHNGPRTKTGHYQHQNQHGRPDNRSEETDAAFMREPRISWSAGRGEWCAPGKALADDFVVPGSSVRGALAHRTLFHWNRIQRRFAGTSIAVADPAAMTHEIEALFGMVKERKGAPRGGHRSALIVDDGVFTPLDTMALDHTSIDRFSGGVRTGALFSEELATGTVTGLGIIIDERHFEAIWKTLVSPAGSREDVSRAFNMAVDDLRLGRLSLGAKSSGRFSCEEAVA